MINKRTKLSLMQLVVTLCSLALSLSLGHASVTLTVGEGAGFPGSTDNPVVVSLDNPDDEDEVAGVQIDVCDVDNFLSCTTCDTEERANDFACSINDLGGGCCRILLEPLAGGSIEKGTGPIFTLNYDVLEGAPLGECRDLNPENVKIADQNTPSQPLDVTAYSGQFCFTQIVSTTTTTSPIITTTTTTGPIITTTTTTIPPSCEVSVSPVAVTLQSGTTVQFTAKTSCGEGTYTWQIVPANTIGSTIDQDGLFTAGDNTTETDIEETVRVTDTAHGNKSATATVTIQVKEEPLPECEVTINPSSATVYSGDTLTLEAHTSGVDCEPGNYEWSISSDIGSMIEDGAYTAGNNDTGSQVTDIITVVDHANFDITGATSIYVEGEGTDKRVNIIPCRLLGCRWIPLPYLLLAWGKDAHFDLSSTISFEPGNDISELFQVGCGKIFLALVLLGADAQEGPVAFTISTGEEIVTGEIKIISLFPLAKGLLR